MLNYIDSGVIFCCAGFRLEGFLFRNLFKWLFIVAAKLVVDDLFVSKYLYTPSSVPPPPVTFFLSYSSGGLE